MTSVTLKDGVGANLSVGAYADANGNLAVGHVPLVGGAPVASGNPLPVSAAALGAVTDAEAAADGSVVGLLKRLRTLLSGVLTVSGTAAVGAAPSNPPLSVSGVDGGGLKRHLLTGTDGALVATVRPGISLSPAQVSVTTASGPAVTANASRRYLAFFNNDPSASVTISLAGTAVAGQGYTIQPGGAYVFDANATPTNAFTCIGTAACSLTVWEG